jgi:arylamine N-acetyltransferase
MIDFDAYLHRIGLDPADKPPWQAVHRAHVTTIPFENLADAPDLGHERVG